MTIPRVKPTTSAARRRFLRLLAKTDSEGIPVYGERLARLSQTDQRKVLDLIESGRPQKQVIAELNKLDAARKARNNAHAKVRRFLQKPPSERTGPNRPTDWDTDMWRLYEQGVGISR